MTQLDPQAIMLVVIETMMEIRTEQILTNFLLTTLVVLEVGKIVVPWVRDRLRNW